MAALPLVDTGIFVPKEAKVLDIRAAIDSALLKAIPSGRSKALVGIGRMEGKQFIGELAWVQRVNDNWNVVAGLTGGTNRPISGQVMVGGSWK